MSTIWMRSRSLRSSVLLNAPSSSLSCSLLSLMRIICSTHAPYFLLSMGVRAARQPSPVILDTIRRRVYEGATAQVFHVHKGACDEALAARLDGVFGSEELAVHLVELLKNSVAESDREHLKDLLRWTDR